MADKPKIIYTPEPEGFKVGMLFYDNTMKQVVDIEPAELARKVRLFLSQDDQQLLELRDPQYGLPFWLTKEGARKVYMICTHYVQAIAPKSSDKRTILVPAGTPILKG